MTAALLPSCDVTRIIASTGFAQPFGQLFNRTALVQGRLVHKNKVTLAWGGWVEFFQSHFITLPSGQYSDLLPMSPLLFSCRYAGLDAREMSFSCLFAQLY